MSRAGSPWSPSSIRPASRKPAFFHAATARLFEKRGSTEICWADVCLQDVVREVTSDTGSKSRSSRLWNQEHVDANVSGIIEISMFDESDRTSGRSLDDEAPNLRQPRAEILSAYLLFSERPRSQKR